MNSLYNRASLICVKTYAPAIKLIILPTEMLIGRVAGTITAVLVTPNQSRCSGIIICPKLIIMVYILTYSELLMA